MNTKKILILVGSISFVIVLLALIITYYFVSNLKKDQNSKNEVEVFFEDTNEPEEIVLEISEEEEENEIIDDNQEWVEYKSESLDVKFKYPSNLGIEEKEDGNTITIFSTHQNLSGDRNLPLVRFSTKYSPMTYGDIAVPDIKNRSEMIVDELNINGDKFIFKGFVLGEGGPGGGDYNTEAITSLRNDLHVSILEIQLYEIPYCDTDEQGIEKCTGENREVETSLESIELAKEIVESVEPIINEFSTGNFQILDYYHYSYKGNIYFEGEIIDGIDAESFEVLKSSSTTGLSKDKNNIYLNGEIVEGVISSEFSMVGGLGRDSKSVYFLRTMEKIKDLQPDGLEQIDHTNYRNIQGRFKVRFGEPYSIQWVKAN